MQNHHAVTSSQELVHSSVQDFNFFLKMMTTDPLMGANLNLSHFVVRLAFKFGKNANMSFNFF